MSDTITNACFECDAPATQEHHVVPQIVGGKRTVPLCDKCHDLVHGLARRGDHRELTKIGIEKSRKSGTRWGRRQTVPREKLDAAADEVENGGRTLKETAEIFGISHALIHRHMRATGRENPRARKSYAKRRPKKAEALANDPLFAS